MDAEAAKLLAAGIAVCVGAVGSAIGEGLVAAKALEVMGRNPSIKDDLFIKTIIFMAVTESTAIYSLVVSLILLFVA